MQPEYVTIPLPSGVTETQEALDWLEDFGLPIIKGEKDKLGFKYFKPHTFTINLSSLEAHLTLHLLYSTKPSKKVHL